MADEDEPEDDSGLMEEDEDRDEADLPFWESSALSRIRGILEGARFSVEDRTVTVESDEWDPRGKGDSAPRTFSSLEELRDELIQIGDSEISGHVPWENGPVFSTDSDDLVDEALDEAGVYAFFRSLEAPDESDLILTAEDLARPDRGGPIRVDIEEVNDLLIKYLADHPELMREVHPRRFEELVAELFRRMGYEVALTPRAKDGGFDVLAFQKTGVGTLLTLVECKRFSPDHKVGVGLVRALYGVVEERCATNGVIATTSSFTRGAREFQQNLAYRLSLRDFQDLVLWCNKYRAKQT